MLNVSQFQKNYLVIMSDDFNIEIKNLTKTFTLYANQNDKIKDILGLTKIGFKLSKKPKKFNVLDRINLNIKKGEKLGIIGRNGAGKTTLLKLISNFYHPTSGRININGQVKALMSLGTGFNPEFTGRENIITSLTYQNLSKEKLNAAKNDIIDFCELDDYLDQPFKNYSLGMQSRLMFATATSVKPDILIIDEVLNAGDVYFIHKSKSRIQNLIETGCTLIVVSHSMQQILEFCEKAIWLDQGKILMNDEPLKVVKAYEKEMYGNKYRKKNMTKNSYAENKSISSSINEESVCLKNVEWKSDDYCSLIKKINSNKDYFLPRLDKFYFETKGGISSWNESSFLRFTGFDIIFNNTRTNILYTLEPVLFRFKITTSQDINNIELRYSIAIYNEKSERVSNLLSSPDKFKMKSKTDRIITFNLNPLLLGEGFYNVSIAMHKFNKISDYNNTECYDLLNRSFEFEIKTPTQISNVSSSFYQRSDWYSYGI